MYYSLRLYFKIETDEGTHYAELKLSDCQNEFDIKELIEDGRNVLARTYKTRAFNVTNITQEEYDKEEREPTYAYRIDKEGNEYVNDVLRTHKENK